MYRIKYETWNEICELIKNYSQKFGNFYFQLYPIKYSRNYDSITDIEYFKKNVFSENNLSENEKLFKELISN